MNIPPSVIAVVMAMFACLVASNLYLVRTRSAPPQQRAAHVPGVLGITSCVLVALASSTGLIVASVIYKELKLWQSSLLSLLIILSAACLGRVLDLQHSKPRAEIPARRFGGGMMNRVDVDSTMLMAASLAFALVAFGVASGEKSKQAASEDTSISVQTSVSTKSGSGATDTKNQVGDAAKEGK